MSATRARSTEGAAAPQGVRATAQAIRDMRIRGAAAIGQAAAHALADHVSGLDGAPAAVLARARAAARTLDAARPTAVTLHNALGWVLQAVAAERKLGAQKSAARAAARRLDAQVKASRAAIAAHGARQVRRGGIVLTHCHSSTAVAVLAAAQRQGKRPEVIATETRPFRQGLRTVRALREAGVSCTLIVDSAVEHVLATRDVDLVLVGADTVAADGALFNKVGTAGVAALAQRHDVPVLCAAGLHKFTRLPSAAVPIEERPAREVVEPRDLAPGARVFNPVFDRTEPALLAAYVTEGGLMSPRRAVARNRPQLPREEAWG